MSLISATPFKINNMELKNRIIMLVMHTGFSTGGQLTEQDKAFFEERAKGGAAAVTQVVGVSEFGAADNMPNIRERKRNNRYDTQPWNKAHSTAFSQRKKQRKQLWT